MWLFRSRPDALDETQRAELQRLFDCVPGLEFVYHFRWGLTDVFDTARSRAAAAAQFEEYRSLLDEDDEDHRELLAYFRTYDAHRDGILAYFDARQTSGQVEGLNNKARVVTKRCYGLKSIATLWQRLCLDVNLATRALGHSLRDITRLARHLRRVFSGNCG
jgi:transposase